MDRHMQSASGNRRDRVSLELTMDNFSVINESNVIRQRNTELLNCCKKSLILSGIFSIILSLVFALLGFLLLNDCKTNCDVQITSSEVLRMFSGSFFVIGVILLIVRACQLGIKPAPTEFDSTDDLHTVVSTIPEEGLEKSPARIAMMAYHEMPRVTQWTCLSDDGILTSYDIKYGYRSDNLRNDSTSKIDEDEAPPSYEEAIQMVAGQI